MRREDFEFVNNRLSTTALEDAITDKYDLGYTNSSNLPAILKVDHYPDTHIYAVKGRVECSITIYDKSISEEEHEYTYRVTNVNVTHSRRKL